MAKIIRATRSNLLLTDELEKGSIPIARSLHIRSCKEVGKTTLLYCWVVGIGCILSQLLKGGRSAAPWNLVRFGQGRHNVFVNVMTGRRSSRALESKLGNSFVGLMTRQRDGQACLPPCVQHLASIVSSYVFPEIRPLHRASASVFTITTS